MDYGPTGSDRRHVFNAYYIWELPIGQGRRLSTGKVLDRIVGGWYTSGTFSASTAAPLTVTQSSQAWGGATSTIGVNSAMVPTGTITNSSVNSGAAGCTLAGVGSVGTTAATGAGLNVFGDPCAVYGSFRYLQLSADSCTGRANPMRGLGFWNADFRLSKDTKIAEKSRLGFSADFFNLFNHHNYNTPSLSYTNPTSFGVITSTFTPPNRTNSARWIQMGMRLDF